MDVLDRLTTVTTTTVGDDSPHGAKTLTERGCELASEFNIVREKLQAASDIVASIKAAGSMGPTEKALEASPTFLSYALDTATSVGLEVHHSAHIHVVVAHFVDLATDVVESSIVDALRLDGSDLLGIGRLASFKFPESVVKEAQGAAISAACVSIAESTEEETHEKAARMCSFLAAVAQVGDLDSDIDAFAKALLCVARALLSMANVDATLVLDQELGPALKILAAPTPPFEKLQFLPSFGTLVNGARAFLMSLSVNRSLEGK